MIQIIDFGAGNLKSIIHALQNIYQGKVEVIDNASLIDKNSIALILPGDGSFPSAIKSLNQRGFSKYLKRDLSKPLLGICVGFQLLFQSSSEGGGAEGLGLVSGNIKKFKETDKKVPHIGWNQCKLQMSNDPILKETKNDSYFYFVHSFYSEYKQQKESIMTCQYKESINAAIKTTHPNGALVYGFQFHPEKSSNQGWKILNNFLNSCSKTNKGLTPC